MKIKLKVKNSWSCSKNMLFWKLMRNRFGVIKHCGQTNTATLLILEKGIYFSKSSKCLLAFFFFFLLSFLSLNYDSGINQSIIS